MATIEQKRRYVVKSKQTREHHCHWPGCEELVPPAKWGCLKHWKMLPLELRNLIWQTYRIGQETNLTPSKAYIAAANKVQKWVQENHSERKHTKS
jgi:hypothetical protein